MLARCICIKLCPSVFNFDFQLSSRTIRCSFEHEMLQEVSSTRAFKCFVAGARSNKYTDGGNLAIIHELSANFDAILRDSCLHWTINLEGFRNLSTLQITEILLSRLSRELQITLLLLE